MSVDLLRDFAAGVYPSEAPSPPTEICVGWCSNSVGSESGQKQCVKLLQNMVSNTTQLNSPLNLFPAMHTLSVYTVLYFELGKGDWGR
jgi:hypothetical protein